MLGRPITATRTRPGVTADAWPHLDGEAVKIRLIADGEGDETHGPQDPPRRRARRGDGSRSGGTTIIHHEDFHLTKRAIVGDLSGSILRKTCLLRKTTSSHNPGKKQNAMYIQSMYVGDQGTLPHARQNKLNHSMRLDPRAGSVVQTTERRGEHTLVEGKCPSSCSFRVMSLPHK